MARTGGGCASKLPETAQSNKKYKTKFKTNTNTILAHCKYPIFKVSGPKKPLRVWLLEPEASNVEHLGPLGKGSEGLLVTCRLYSPAVLAVAARFPPSLLKQFLDTSAPGTPQVGV